MLLGESVLPTTVAPGWVLRSLLGKETRDKLCCGFCVDIDTSTAFGVGGSTVVDRIVNQAVTAFQEARNASFNSGFRKVPREGCEIIRFFWAFRGQFSLRL